jgi:hypothetical protein
LRDAREKSGEMPREITYGEQPAFLAMADGNEYPAGSVEAKKFEGTGAGKYRRRGVEVSWVNGGVVEVGVAAFDPAKERPNGGVFTTLDRDGINKMIRTLRIARDAAYGKDQ